VVGLEVEKERGSGEERGGKKGGREGERATGGWELGKEKEEGERE
jgi:hypothetical protein